MGLSDWINFCPGEGNNGDLYTGFFAGVAMASIEYAHSEDTYNSLMSGVVVGLIVAAVLAISECRKKDADTPVLVCLGLDAAKDATSEATGLFGRIVDGAVSLIAGEDTADDVQTAFCGDQSADTNKYPAKEADIVLTSLGVFAATVVGSKLILNSSMWMCIGAGVAAAGLYAYSDATTFCSKEKDPDRCKQMIWDAFRDSISDIFPEKPDELGYTHKELKKKALKKDGGTWAEDWKTSCGEYRTNSDFISYDPASSGAASDWWEEVKGGLGMSGETSAEKAYDTMAIRTILRNHALAEKIRENGFKGIQVQKCIAQGVWSQSDYNNLYIMEQVTGANKGEPRVEVSI